MSAENSAAALKNIHSARGEFYSFFSRVFANVPDDDFYRMTAEMLEKIKLLAVDTANGDIKSGTEDLEAFLKERGSLSGKELSDFDVETARSYTFLFCLPKSIPADESIYTSSEHRERQASWEDMKRLFVRYGMQKTSRIPENEDFVSYELLFMSKLAYDCAEFADSGDMTRCSELVKAQLDFHKNHLDKWIGSFLGKVINSTIEKKAFYGPLSRIAYGFIAEDKLALGELASE